MKRNMSGITKLHLEQTQSLKRGSRRTNIKQDCAIHVLVNC